MFHQAAGRGGYRVCILDCAEDLNVQRQCAFEAHRGAAAALAVSDHRAPARPHACDPAFPLPQNRSQTPGAAAIGHIVAALGPPWSAAGEAKLAAAIARAHGSIHDVLRLLDDRGIELDTNLGRMLDDLPRIDWSKVHALADRVAARNNGKDYETMLAAIDAWLDTKVRRGALSPEG